MNNIKEVDIQKTICEYLTVRMRQKKLMFSRVNNTPIFDTGRQAFRAMPKFTLQGFADIIIVKEGWAIFLEVKTTKGRQSDGQKEFERLVKENSGEYHVVRSLQDVIDLGL